MAAHPQEISVCEGPHSDAHLRCIHNAVGAKATKWPDSIALTSGSQVVTYQELDSRANRVAHYLRSLAVGPDVLVGICLPRSVDMVVAALGVLKAGGAYLPLDPSYPPDRLSFILRDAGVAALITNPLQAGRLPASDCVIVDVNGAEVQGEPDYPPRIEVLASDLAYVIYTSGTAGKPKGVEIAHSGLANLVSWHRREFSVTPGDRASHLAGLGFDAAVWELWPYLAAGASVHLVDDATRASARLLRDWLLTRKITMSFVPTPLAERLLTLEWPNTTPLRIMLTGGDTLHRYPRAKLPFTLVNNYGPTECAVVATSCPVQAEANATGRPPIGRPITNTRIYILDEDLDPVPLGEPGEICIAGAGVARGYHNQPGLTAERFLGDPYSSAPGGRLYRTGDRGAFLPDGQIAFLGRMDDQIKIRGYRIEPNEIVYVLDQHPDIRQCLVTALEDKSEDKRLAAYLVLAPGSTPSHAALHDFLSGQLPEYMVPAVFIVLDTFPLTAHGKIDRAALPQPTAENMLGNGPVQVPESMLEGRLTGILSKLLRLEQVAADENFFQMGGHSLLGAQVIAHVRETFGVEFSLRSLFEHPTAREMAQEIERLILTKLEAISGEEAGPAPICTGEVNA